MKKGVVKTFDSKARANLVGVFQFQKATQISRFFTDDYYC